MNKKKITAGDIFSGIFATLFVVCVISMILVFIVGIPIKVYTERQIDKVPREYGYITSKSSDEPSITISFDVEYKGEIVTRKRTYNVTIAEYMATDYGDVIYFDDNNEPVFPAKRK